GFSTQASPQSFSSLLPGSHTFQVRAVDAAGNTGGATGYTWTIDTTAPAVSSIVRADGNPTNAATRTYTVTFSEAVTGVVTGDFTPTTPGTRDGATANGAPGRG